MTRYLQQILTQAVITIPLIPNVILGKYWIKQKYKLWSEMDQFSMQIDKLSFTFHFCPRCGTSIWWLPARVDGPLKGKVGIAGGCFASAELPVPTLSIYEKHKHS